MKILVTGASGFIGSALLRRLTVAASHQVVAATRNAIIAPVTGVTTVRIGDLDANTNWLPLLSGVDTVIHLAARVHVMRDASADPLAEFRKANVDVTLDLARQAAAAGVARFIYLSSIKVNGEATAPGHSFGAEDPPAPGDPYAISKHEAEQGLRALATRVSMTVLTIRPPLVYGPGVRANFLRLMAMIDHGIPLPLGAIRNARSMVSIWNLCDLIRRAVEVPALRPGVLMVADGEDLSTPELIRRIAAAMRRPARLFSVPVPVLETLGRLAGKTAQVARLCDSLTVDISATRQALNWMPPMSVDEALRTTVQWFVGEGTAHGH
jgi:nucleoside-diphosphate-sugar epimerase